NTISKLPLAVYKQTNKGRVPYVDHKWYDTLKHNPDLSMSSSKWLSFALTKMYLTGNFFALKSEFDSSLKERRQLKALPDLKNVVESDGEIYYKFDGIPQWIASKDVIHFYLISKDGVTGLNPINSIRSEIEIQHGSESAVKNFYRNGTF